MSNGLRVKCLVWLIRAMVCLLAAPVVRWREEIDGRICTVVSFASGRELDPCKHQATPFMACTLVFTSDLFALDIFDVQ